MRKQTAAFLFIFLVFSTAQAYFETLTLSNYKEISKVFDKATKAYSSDELLFVFDLDKTVIHSIDCLPKPKSGKKVNGFFKFENTVEKCPASITSPLLPSIIENLQNQSYPVMALTARRSKILKGTLAQLEDRLILSEEDKTPLKIQFPTAPHYSTRKKTISFKQQGRKKVLDKTLVVKKGVAMASGANKGLALQAFTKSLKKKNTFKHIIFVDDDKKNIRNLEKAYADSKESITIIHYTEFDH